MLAAGLFAVTTVTVVPTAFAAGVSGPRLTQLAVQARKLTTEHIPYSLGGHGAKPAPLGSSVDCSGMVRALYYWAYGVDIGSGTGDSMVRTSGKFVKTSHPVPGDVVLFGSGGSAPAYHAMIYVGVDNGQRTAVASPTYGQNIKYQTPEGSYWKSELMGYWHYKGATAADSAPLNGTGAITSIKTGPNWVEVAGWTADRANPSGSNHVSLMVDGKLAYGGWSKLPSNIAGFPGKHGFHVRIGARPGKHTITLTSTGKVSGKGLSPHTFTVSTPPATGAITLVKAGSNSVEVAGWTADRANPSGSNHVALMVDGKLAYGGWSKLPSNIAGFPGKHGFHVKIGARPGKHTITLTSTGKVPGKGLSPHIFTVR